MYIYIGQPSSTSRKEAISIWSDARYPSHLHATLKQYRSKSAATQLCVENTSRLYYGRRQRIPVVDLPEN